MGLRYPPAPPVTDKPGDYDPTTPDSPSMRHLRSHGGFLTMASCPYCAEVAADAELR
ncbi:MAG TPA: hypothetical protein VMW08_00480 [Acidimicrobiales bacterium]|nr:hypothetical protein [Acidimicrobiales bacterium]